VEHVETWAFEAEAAALERVDRVGLELTARSLAAKRTRGRSAASGLVVSSGAGGGRGDAR